MPDQYYGSLLAYQTNRLEHSPCHGLDAKASDNCAKADVLLDFVVNLKLGSRKPVWHVHRSEIQLQLRRSSSENERTKHGSTTHLKIIHDVTRVDTRKEGHQGSQIFSRDSGAMEEPLSNADL